MRTLLIAVIAASVLGASAKADMIDDCLQDTDEKKRIDACTQAIESGQWSGPDLAWAYNNRGAAYDDLENFDRALSDLNEALRLDPGDADTLFNRANTLCSMGQHENTVDGYRDATRQNPRVAQQMQSFLQSSGFYNGPVDGRFGPASEAALVTWSEASCR